MRLDNLGCQYELEMKEVAMMTSVTLKTAKLQSYHLPPRAGSGIVRMDPLRFLARCHKRRLNQALSVLSLSLGFF